VNNLGDVGAGHVLGRYELLMPIATGGMATVWAARLKGSRGFQKIVAIKTILPQLSEDPTFEQMFLDEASLASRIRHPNVAQILDLGEEAGTLFLVMDWVDGEPLSAVLKTASRQTGSIPLPITIRIISQAAAGLHAAHELRDEAGNLLGLVHRDASPQNILVTFDGVVKVVDFGIAKAAGRGTADTNAGQIKGKAAYMAPEQVKGHELDRRADVFALGTILYFMTTGKHPFRGENDVATLYNISSDSPVTLPSRLNRHFPLSLEAVVMKSLAKNPRDRFGSAHELQRALDMALPASQRLTTDAEVAAFMHSLLGERHEQRKSALKMALRLADERGQGRTSTPAMPTSDSISHTGFTPPSNVSGLMAPREFQPRSDAPSEPSHGAAQSVGGITTPTDRWGLLARGRMSSGARVGVAAAGIALTLATGIFVAAKLASRGSLSEPGVAAPAVAVNPPASAPPLVPTAAQSSAPAADIDPSHAEPAALPDPTAVPPDAPSGPPKGASRPPQRAPGKPGVVATQPSAPPKPASTAFVPPVRNPGF
jgi:serine/threonine-protein kinase